MVKTYENLDKSQKISKITLKKDIEKKIYFAGKKICYPLCFPILGGGDSTRVRHSSLFKISGGVP